MKMVYFIPLPIALSKNRPLFRILLAGLLAGLVILAALSMVRPALAAPTPPYPPGEPAVQPGSTPASKAPIRINFIFTVMNANDSGAGSLRQAIASAAAGDTIVFDSSLSGGTISLTSAQLDIDKNLTIDGSSLASPVSISGNNARRVLNIYNGAVVTLRNITVINGYTDNGAGAAVAGGSTLNVTGSLFSSNRATNFGGGIYNLGTLNVTVSTFTGNRAAWGGGLENRATLSIADALFTSNTADSGGAGAETYGGAVTITRSAFLNNLAFDGGNNGSGGGFQTDPGTGNVFLTNVTFSGNQANGSADDGGGAIMTYGGTLFLTNLSLANNHAATHGGGISTSPSYPATINLYNDLIWGNTMGTVVSSDLFGPFVSQDYNLIGVLTGATLSGTTTHNLIGQNPALNTLADNGGSTQSFALLPGSPAIDAIPNGVNGCGGTLTEDQRGEPRPANYPDRSGGCDIGAFELQSDENFTGLLTDGSTRTFGATLTTIQDLTGGAAPGLTTVTRNAFPSSSIGGGGMPFQVTIAAAVSSGLDFNLSLCYTAWEASINPSVHPSLLELYHFDGSIWQRIGADSRFTDPITGVTCVTKNHTTSPGLWTLIDSSVPTAVTMADFSLKQAIGQVRISWQTAQEIDTVGFNLYRSLSADSTGAWQKLNAVLIPSQAPGSVSGASYAYTDIQVRPGVQHFYWLEVVSLDGLQVFGPLGGESLLGIYLPLVGR